MTPTPASINDHAYSGNRRSSEPAKRFFSTPPSLANRQRHPVHAAGFEALAGFALPAAAPAVTQRLRPISELTFGAPLVALAPPPLVGNQSVVPDTTVYPWCANCALRITIPGKSDVFGATGWFAGPYAVITAAHVVYPRENGGFTGWVSEIEVIPGQDGEGNNPNGSSKSSTFFCPTGWQSVGTDALDYGVILLAEDLGARVGTYGYSTYTDADLSSAVANLAGYPVVAPNLAQPAGKEWYSANNVVDVDNSFVYYDLGTGDGDSGAAVYRNIGNDSYVMAIHTSANGSRGRGVRIIDPVYSNIQHWAGMQG